MTSLVSSQTGVSAVVGGTDGLSVLQGEEALTLLVSKNPDASHLTGNGDSVAR